MTQYRYDTDAHGAGVNTRPPRTRCGFRSTSSYLVPPSRVVQTLMTGITRVVPQKYHTPYPHKDPYAPRTRTTRTTRSLLPRQRRHHLVHASVPRHHSLLRRTRHLENHMGHHLVKSWNTPRNGRLSWRRRQTGQYRSQLFHNAGTQI